MKRNWLYAVIVVEAVVIVCQRTPPPARADIPDAGAQRNEVIDQLKGVNDRLDKLSALLEGGHVQVKVIRADDAKAHGL